MATRASAGTRTASGTRGVASYTVTTGTSDRLLQEIGDFLLLETGDKFLLESDTGGGTTTYRSAAGTRTTV